MGQDGGEAKQPGRWRTIGRGVYYSLLILVSLLAVAVTLSILLMPRQDILKELDPRLGWTLVSYNVFYLELDDERWPDRMERKPPEERYPVYKTRWNAWFAHYGVEEWRGVETNRCYYRWRRLGINIRPTAIVLWTWPATALALHLFRRRKDRARGFEVIRP